MEREDIEYEITDGRESDKAVMTVIHVAADRWKAQLHGPCGTAVGPIALSDHGYWLDIAETETREDVVRRGEVALDVLLTKKGWRRV